MGAGAALSVINDACQARMLLLGQAGMLLRLSMVATELGPLVDSGRSVLLRRGRGHGLVIVQKHGALVRSCSRMGQLLLWRQGRGAAAESDGATQASNRLCRAVLGIILIVYKRLRVVHVRRLDRVRLREAAHTLLAKVVASLAICLLSVDHVLQGLVLH